MGKIQDHMVGWRARDGTLYSKLDNLLRDLDESSLGHTGGQCSL